MSTPQPQYSLHHVAGDGQPEQRPPQRPGCNRVRRAVRERPSAGATWSMPPKPTRVSLRDTNARDKRTFGPHSSAALNMTGLVCDICQIQYRNPHFMGKGGREDRRVPEGLDAAAGPAQPAPGHPRVRACTRLPGRRLHRGDGARAGVREASAAPRADEHPRARRPPGRQRTLAARAGPLAKW